MSLTSPLSPAHSFVPGPPVINIHPLARGAADGERGREGVEDQGAAVWR